MSLRAFSLFLGISLVVLGVPLVSHGEEDLLTSPAYSSIPGNVHYNVMNESPAFNFMPGNRYYYLYAATHDDGAPSYADKSEAIVAAILGFFGNPKDARLAVIGQQRLTSTVQDAADKVKATLTQNELSQLRDDLLEGKSLPAILTSLVPGGQMNQLTLTLARTFDRRIEPYGAGLPRAERALIAAIWVKRMEDTIRAKSLKATRKTAALLSEEESALQNFALARRQQRRPIAVAGAH